MAGGYLPQQVRRARADGRLLGLVRDLLVMRKPLRAQEVGSPPASSYTFARTNGLESVGLRLTSGPGSDATA